MMTTGSKSRERSKKSLHLDFDKENLITRSATSQPNVKSQNAQKALLIRSTEYDERIRPECKKIKSKNRVHI